LVIAFLAAAVANDRYDVVDVRIAWEWSLLSLPVIWVAALLGWLRYRDDGWLVRDDGRVVIRSRPLHRVTTVTTVSRIQHHSLTDNPLQRRARLASFSAAVASGGGGGMLGIAHLDRADGERLIGLLGRSVRSTGSVSA
jgi:uncharacterized membrane protein YdbT with pleckstrin-like domain